MFTDADATIAGRASRGDGVFHRREARRAGLTDRQIGDRLRCGAWVEVLPRVYRNAATPPTLAMLRRAALLWAGGGAVLSHRSAGAVWDLDGVVETVPEVSVPPARNPRSPLVAVHRTTLPPGDTGRRAGLACTSIARTIADLAHDLDEEALECAIESARHRHGTTLRAVQAQLDRTGGPGRPGTARLRRVLGVLDPRAPSESALEVKAARLLRLQPLPRPERQYWLTAFGRRYRFDFAWPGHRVALECDGRAFHDFQRDRTRWRHVGASGWRVLPVTWHDITRRPDAVVAELRTALVR
jgi:very-short-patch-repair endonuclease